jgi:diguanylate cyclase (GGDEF)-like protein/PAS domain S-box-containing protein
MRDTRALRQPMKYTNRPRLESDAALPEGDELLRAVLDAIPDVVALKDERGAYLFANQVLANLYGTTPQAMVGRVDADFGVPGELAEFLQRSAQEVMSSGHTQVMVQESRDAVTGEPRFFKATKRPLRDAQGRPRLLIVSHDITDVVQAQQRVAESEQRLLEAARLARVGHWRWHLTTGELQWTDETYAIFGYQRGEVVPSFELFATMIHPEDRERVEAAVRRAIEHDAPYMVEMRFTRRDGQQRLGRATGRVQRDAFGQPAVMSGAMQDVTSLRETEQRFNVAFRASPLAASIARLDDGMFVEANDRYLPMFGYRRDEMIGKSAVDLGIWPSAAARQAFVDALRTKGTLVGYETPLLHRDGTVRQAAFFTEMIQIDQVPHLLTFVQDITERKEAEARIEYLAHHDPLTGLPNRVLFRDRMALAMAWAERNGGKVALLFVDLDHFKTINDTLGHPVGDALLQQVAQRLRACVRDTDTISRLGGDEFLVALTDVADSEDVAQVASKITESLAVPMQVQGHDLPVTLSAGIAMWPDDGLDFDLLLQRADTAMYQAKAAGRNTWRFYTAQMNAEALERLQLRTALRRAMDTGEFQLHYQPLVELASGQVVGVEALLRWRRAGGELIEPARFIPVAEESGLIVPIGEWVLREACAQAVRWQSQGLGELVVAVNLSAVQFRRGNLEVSVAQALADSGLDPQWLELELTESLLLDDAEGVLETARRFKTLGVRLSIDDFGTGYSSLAYLKRFDVDKLKVDRSFVRDMTTDPDDATIVRAIIGMARALKLKVIAEGVENADTARLLGIYRCDEAQGFHYARPMDGAALATWLEARRAAEQASGAAQGIARS